MQAEPDQKEKKNVIEYGLNKVAISDLKFDKKNPNKMTNEAFSGLTQSMLDIGNVYPILIDQNNFIVSGNHRAEVYKSLGIKAIPAFRRNFKNNNERMLWSQALNKLHGKYDEVLDANQLTQLYKAGSLQKLSDLIAKRMQDFQQAILEHSTIANKALLDKLVGGDSALRGKGTLALKFGIPPFSVLDTTSDTWQKRKDQWLYWGIRPDKGRGDAQIFKEGGLTDYSPISIFDPVLTEIMYRWFAPKAGSLILDPFAGGDVRGIIASFLGHYYYGIDCRKEQINANVKQLEKIQDSIPAGNPEPKWIHGDSQQLNQNRLLFKKSFDMLFTCPPYFNLEKYSNQKDDISNLKDPDFINALIGIINASCNMLAEYSCAVWVMENTHRATGALSNILSTVIEAFIKNGFMFINDLVLIHPVGTLRMRVEQSFRLHRFVGQRHENVLVFYRGKDKSNIPELDPNIVDIPAPPPTIGSNPTYDKSTLAE